MDVILGLLLIAMPPQCYVTGMVYGTPTIAETDAILLVTDGCPITIVRFERTVTMASPRWQVEVQIPERGGWLNFRYLWGQNEVAIGKQRIEVHAEPRLLTNYAN